MRMGIGVVGVVDTVAVGMITRDSIKQRGVGVLTLVLRRLLSEVPNVTRIIISDASRDGTLRFIAGLTASAIPGIPNGVIMMTMWLNGKGWTPAYAGTLGAIVNMVTLTLLAHPLGIWAITAANLTGNTTTLAVLLTHLA